MIESPAPGRYVLAYLLWLVTLALSLLCAMLTRTVYQFLAVSVGWSPATIRVLDNFALVIIALVLVTVIVMAEHSYRTGVHANRLFLRFSTFTLGEVVVLALLQLTLVILQLMLGNVDIINIGIFIIVALLAWLLTRWRKSLKA